MLVTPEAEYVVTDNIEALRMREEETPGLEVLGHQWYEDPAPLYRELAGGAPLGADFPLASARNISEGLITPVVLVAADDRIACYRHPIPRGATVERRVMLVVSAELRGLYVSLTHIVHLEEPDEDFRRRQGACAEILRCMREEATRPGRALADVFEDCKGFYAEAGFPDEWRLHHQGGMAGYASREIIAPPETREEIKAGQAFAWNPSITGAKAEETFVLTENGSEVISSGP